MQSQTSIMNTNDRNGLSDHILSSKVEMLKTFNIDQYVTKFQLVVNLCKIKILTTDFTELQNRTSTSSFQADMGSSCHTVPVYRLQHEHPPRK